MSISIVMLLLFTITMLLPFQCTLRIHVHERSIKATEAFVTVCVWCRSYVAGMKRWIQNRTDHGNTFAGQVAMILNIQLYVTNSLYL